MKKPQPLDKKKILIGVFKAQKERIYNKFESLCMEPHVEFWIYFQFLSMTSLYKTLNQQIDKNIIRTLDEFYIWFQPFYDIFNNELETLTAETKNTKDLNETSNNTSLRANLTDETTIIFKNVETCFYTTFSANNIFVNLTGVEGRTQHIQSCGLIGLKGPKKRTRIAVQETIEKAYKKLSDTRNVDLILFLRGFNKNRRTVFDTLSNTSKINILQIIDKTNKAHNGCKSKKLRRV